ERMPVGCTYRLNAMCRYAISLALRIQLVPTGHTPRDGMSASDRTAAGGPFFLGLDNADKSDHMKDRAT
ncbi:MAG: hypothetical protein ACXVIN_07900, partial [Halobacteriota archaeon]